MAEKKACSCGKESSCETKSAAQVPTKKATRTLVKEAAKAAVTANTAIGRVRAALIARGELKPNCPLCKKLARADEIDSEFFGKVKELGY